jgi:2-phosphosulfolactate phosphatase
MTIDVALSPADIALLPQRDLSATTCVVFDVLRATSSMITGLAHGAAEIHPVRTVEEAFELRATLPNALLGGERHGDRIEGFDLGNSPLEYLDVRGRQIITTTTNGTLALRACERAHRVLVGAILNLAALVAEIRRSEPEQLLLVCAGNFADFALVDASAAGMLIRMLGKAELSDAAHAALGVAQLYPEPIDALRRARNGRVLSAKGRAEEVEWCAQISRFNIVGLMEGAIIRPLAAA